MRTQSLISQNNFSHSYVNPDGTITNAPLIYKPSSGLESSEGALPPSRVFFKLPKWLKEFFDPKNFTW